MNTIERDKILSEKFTKVGSLKLKQQHFIGKYIIWRYKDKNLFILCSLDESDDIKVLYDLSDLTIIDTISPISIYDEKDLKQLIDKLINLKIVNYE